MNPYIDQWLKVIDGMNNDNTYKLAWGRAIVEICHFCDIERTSDLVIEFDDICEYFLKYFWNQTYFFKLYQGPAKSKPRIQRITELMIIEFQLKSHSKQPVWFDIAKPILQDDMIWYRRMIRRISSYIKADVCWRFTKVEQETIPLYILDMKNRRIKFDFAQVE